MLEQIVRLILLRQVVDEGNGHDGRQLERPPYHHLHGKQRETNPRRNARKEHRKGGNLHITLVEHRQKLPVTPRHKVLPNADDKQNGREDKVDQHIRNQHDAEQNNDERQYHQRRIDDGGMLHLLSLQADIQTQEDSLQQPGNVDDEPRAHLNEVPVRQTPYQHYDDGKQRNADHIVQHRTLHLEVLPTPPLRQQPSQHDITDAKRQSKVEDQENADEKHRRTTPLGIHPPVALEGFVLKVDG